MLVKFFSFPVFLVIVISGQSTPAALKEDIQLLKYEHDNNPDGSYKFGYFQSDGQTREEEASVRYDGGNQPILSVSGSYSFIGPDGVVYTVNYVADENGFQAFGEHLPRILGFEIPPMVLKTGKTLQASSRSGSSFKKTDASKLNPTLLKSLISK